MPRRTILSDTELAGLLALPDTEAEAIRRYTFSDADLTIIAQHRGPANRLGVAVQLCYMRYPGIVLAADDAPSASLLRLVAAQLKVSPEHWAAYGKREQTRREHLVELQTVFGFQLFGKRHYPSAVHGLEELAWQTDKGVVLAAALVDSLRQQSILLPTLPVIERICSEAITRGNRRIYRALNEPLVNTHRRRLDDLLERREDSKKTHLQWLRQSPGRPNSRHMLEHIERLKYLQAAGLPDGIGRSLHQNHLLKLAREGDQMRAAELAKFEPQRRYATLVAFLPALRRVIGGTGDQVPVFGFQFAAMLQVDPHAVGQGGKRAELPLLIGAVADPHRQTASVTAHGLHGAFFEAGAAIDAVNDLERRVGLRIQSPKPMEVTAHLIRPGSTPPTLPPRWL